MTQFDVRTATRTHPLIGDAARLIRSAQIPDRRVCDCGTRVLGLQPYCEPFMARLDRYAAQRHECADCGEPADGPGRLCPACAGEDAEEATHRAWVHRYAATSGDA